MTNHPTTRRRLLVASGVTVGGVLAGCASDSEEPEDDGLPPHYTEPSHPHRPGVPESEVTVYMNSDDGAYFDPSICHVEEGGEVTWQLASGRHNTVAMHPDTYGPQQRVPDGGEPWGSDIMQFDDETFTHTFDVPGIYDYLCIPHISAGMFGSVIVGWPDLDDQPGLEPVSEDYRESMQVERNWEVFSAWIEYLNEAVVEILE